MLKIGILGAGGIAAAVVSAVEDGRLASVQIVNVAGSTPDSSRAQKLAQIAGARATPAGEVHEGVDVVLEAATGQAAREHLVRIWRAGVDTVVMSVGALLDAELAAEATRFRSLGGRVIYPAGAIAGLDGVRAMAVSGGLNDVSITTTKSPIGLRGAPYLTENGIELPENRRVEVFSGNAYEAALGFPANVNVAAALSLAGIGAERTRVVIYSDPAAVATSHVVRALGDSGELEVSLSLRPSPDNPSTSYLAALSAISTVQELSESAPVNR